MMLLNPGSDDSTEIVAAKKLQKQRTYAALTAFYSYSLVVALGR